MKGHKTLVPRRTGYWLLGALAVAAGAVIVAQVAEREWTWSGILGEIRREFPAVRQLSVGELAAWLGDPQRPAPLLLDVREPAEYAVSHLHGAVRVDPDAEAIGEIPAPSDLDRPIVVYCSVGYRSSALAERLIAAGYSRVHNLEGSIFAWANAGQPVVRGGEEVRQVHPFDAKWGRLLSLDLHPAEP